MAKEKKKNTLKNGSTPDPPKKKRGRPPKTVTMADGTKLKETPDILAEEETTKDGKRPKTYEWFTVIIYPEDDNHPDLEKPHKGDPMHEVFLRYIETYEPEYAFIHHDKDYKEDGKKKPTHVHLIFKHYARVTLKTAQKTFACWHVDKHLQTCSAPLAMAYYLPHLTPECVALKKHPYPISTISHTEYFKKTFAKLNKNEILFNSGAGMIADLLNEYDCTTISKALATLERAHIDYHDHISEYMFINMIRDVRDINKIRPNATYKQYVTVNHRGEVLSVEHEHHKHDNLVELENDLFEEADNERN